MDKRSTQIPLPLTMKDKQSIEIRQHWELTFARQPKIGVVAKRMFALVLAQIDRDNNNELRPYYEMHASDVVKDSKGGSAYKQCTKAFKDLASINWMIQDLDRRKATPRTLLDTTKTEEDDGFVTGYDDGRIIISVNKALKPYFVELSHYSKFYLTTLDFTSWYSFRFWEILSAFKDTGYWKIGVSEYKKWMDCEEKYTKPDGTEKISELLKKTADKALEELGKTDLAFKVEKVTEQDHTGKGRKRITHFLFTLNNYPLKSTERLNKWVESSNAGDGDLARAVERGRGKWKISDANLVKALPVLKKDIWKVYQQFINKQNSDDRMNDVAKFCNKVIIAETEKRLKEKS